MFKWLEVLFQQWKNKSVQWHLQFRYRTFISYKKILKKLVFEPRKLSSKRHSTYFSSVIMKASEGWPLAPLDLYKYSDIKGHEKSSER